MPKGHYDRDPAVRLANRLREIADEVEDEMRKIEAAKAAMRKLGIDPDKIAQLQG